MKKFLLALAAGCVLTFSAFVLFSCQVDDLKLQSSDISQTSDPTSDPVDQTSDPIDQTSDPVDPTSDPVDPTSDPTDPTSDPVDPTSDPVDPTSDPVDPTSDPTDPTSDPVDPTSDPVDPTSDPTDPTTDPVDPTTDPVDPTSDPVDPPEPVYSEFISTKTPEDLYGFNTETKLPFGRYQFRGAYATEWSGTYSNYPYDLEFSSDGTTITLDGQVFNVVEIKEYWTNSSTAYFMGAVLLNKDNTYLCYKYQFYYGTETAPKGYVNMFRTKDEFTGTTLPSSAPAFASSKRTYYSDINYSVLYPELSIRFDARHSSVDGMSYRWVDTATSTQYVINFQTHVTSQSQTFESLDIPVDGGSTRKAVKSPLYEQFCTTDTRPHEGEYDFFDSVDDGEIMFGELIFYLDEDGKRHLLFSKAYSDKTNQKPLYSVQDWLISEDAFNEVLKNFN